MLWAQGAHCIVARWMKLGAPRWATRLRCVCGGWLMRRKLVFAAGDVDLGLELLRLLVWPPVWRNNIPVSAPRCQVQGYLGNSFATRIGKLCILGCGPSRFQFPLWFVSRHQSCHPKVAVGLIWEVGAGHLVMTHWEALEGFKQSGKSPDCPRLAIGTRWTLDSFDSYPFYPHAAFDNPTTLSHGAPWVQWQPWWKMHGLRLSHQLCTRPRPCKYRG